MLRLIDFAMPALIGAAALAAAPCQAREPIHGTGDGAFILVHYDDLDLSQKSGVKTLTQRVRTAASQLCVSPAVDPALASAERQACVQAATAAALPRIQAVAEAQASNRLAAISGERTAGR